MSHNLEPAVPLLCPRWRQVSCRPKDLVGKKPTRSNMARWKLHRTEGSEGSSAQRVPSIGVPPNGWFISWQIHPKMEDLGVPLFQDTSICVSLNIKSSTYWDRWIWSNPSGDSTLTNSLGIHSSHRDGKYSKIAKFTRNFVWNLVCKVYHWIGLRENLIPGKPCFFPWTMGLSGAFRFQFSQQSHASRSLGSLGETRWSTSASVAAMNSPSQLTHVTIFYPPGPPVCSDNILIIYW